MRSPLAASIVTRRATSAPSKEVRRNQRRVTFRSPFDLGYNVTSGRRTPKGNKAVGGVPNSHHLSGRAFDYLPGDGENWEQAVARGRRDYPGAEVFRHGNHVHVEGLPEGFIPLYGRRGTQ